MSHSVENMIYVLQLNSGTFFQIFYLARNSRSQSKFHGKVLFKPLIIISTRRFYDFAPVLHFTKKYYKVNENYDVPVRSFKLRDIF